jgi:hypothetical protein
MKPRELRSKSVGTKVSEAELRVLESRAERAGVTLSEWGETWGKPGSGETWGQTERFLIAAGSPLEHLFCLRGVSIQLEWQRKSHIHVSA